MGKVWYDDDISNGGTAARFLGVMGFSRVARGLRDTRIITAAAPSQREYGVPV